MVLTKADSTKANNRKNVINFQKFNQLFEKLQNEYYHLWNKHYQHVLKIYSYTPQHYENAINIHSGNSLKNFQMSTII